MYIHVWICGRVSAVDCRRLLYVYVPAGKQLERASESSSGALLCCTVDCDKLMMLSSGDGGSGEAYVQRWSAISLQLGQSIAIFSLDKCIIVAVD